MVSLTSGPSPTSRTRTCSPPGLRDGATMPQSYALSPLASASRSRPIMRPRCLYCRMRSAQPWFGGLTPSDCASEDHQPEAAAAQSAGNHAPLSNPYLFLPHEGRPFRLVRGCSQRQMPRSAPFELWRSARCCQAAFGQAKTCARQAEACLDQGSTCGPLTSAGAGAE